ncbi:MAG: hypothetical protein ABR562_07720, partial [Thermoplasmatota archaeon]
LLVLPLVLGRAAGWPAWAWACLAASGLAAAVFVAVDYWGPHWHPAQVVDHFHDDLVHWKGDALLKLESVSLMVVAAALWLAMCRPLKGRAPEGTA